MTVARMPVDRKPTVEQRNGMVAVWDGDEADPVGILMSPDAAIDTAFSLLAEASRQRGGEPVQPVRTTIQIEVATDVNEDVPARLVLDLEGASIAIALSATQLAELAAALGAVSREVG